jgi:hypothetical protein
MLPDAARDLLKIAVAALGIDHDMTVALGKRYEIALRIDDDLLHPARALLDETAQQMRFPRARISLDEQARREKFFEIERNRRAIELRAHVYRDLHKALAGW